MKVPASCGSETNHKKKKRTKAHNKRKAYEKRRNFEHQVENRKRRQRMIGKLNPTVSSSRSGI